MLEQLQDPLPVDLDRRENAALEVCGDGGLQVAHLTRKVRGGEAEHADGRADGDHVTQAKVVGLEARLAKVVAHAEPKVLQAVLREHAGFERDRQVGCNAGRLG